MKAPWTLFLMPPLAISLLLLVGSQFVFLRGSLHLDLGMGQLGAALSLGNFTDIFSDSYYLRSLWLSLGVSAAATVLSVLVAFPVAYILARMANRLSLLLLAAVVVSSFITIVVKVLGLMLIFGSNGPLNRLLMATGLIDQPVTIVGTIPGVVLGLMYYTLGFAVLLFYSVIATVPRALEEAAEVHGATRFGVFTQVVLPLCRPGLAAGALMVFNVSMGGFSSTALIGAGKVLTLPIVIQRTVLLETSYGSGAALAVLLMATVLAINLCSTALLLRSRDQVLA
jgi:putative spermidine/putrescine transport system permease protein